MKIKELYTDLEWRQKWKDDRYIGTEYLVAGFYIPGVLKVQLHGETLTREHFLKILKKLNPEMDRIVFHGPDIGHLERLFKINIRDNYKCLNIQKLVRTFTRRKLFGLKHLEKVYKITRNYPVLKDHEINRFWGYGGKKKKIVLGYNMEDIVNLYLVKKALCEQYKINNEKLDSISRLKHNASSKANLKKLKLL